MVQLLPAVYSARTLIFCSTMKWDEDDHVPAESIAELRCSLDGFSSLAALKRVRSAVRNRGDNRIRSWGSQRFIWSFLRGSCRLRCCANPRIEGTPIQVEYRIFKQHSRSCSSRSLQLPPCARCRKKTSSDADLKEYQLSGHFRWVLQPFRRRFYRLAKVWFPPLSRALL